MAIVGLVALSVSLGESNLPLCHVVASSLVIQIHGGGGNSRITQNTALQLLRYILARLSQSSTHGRDLFRGTGNFRTQVLDVILHVGIVLGECLSILCHRIGCLAGSIRQTIHIAHDWGHLCFQFCRLVRDLLHANQYAACQRCAERKASLSDYTQCFCHRTRQRICAFQPICQGAGQSFYLADASCQRRIDLAHDSDAEV